MTSSYVAIKGREALVEVEWVKGDQKQGTASVEVDGRVYEVNIATTGTARSLLIDGRQFELHAHRKKSQSGTRVYEISVDGRSLDAAVTDPLSRLAQEAAGGEGSAKVEAYMPGRVVALLVAPGDEVEQGQGVLVLEAMKMENEIAAEAAGVVKEFFVEVGQAVEGGDDLFEVTPASDRESA